MAVADVQGSPGPTAGSGASAGSRFRQAAPVAAAALAVVAAVVGGSLLASNGSAPPPAETTLAANEPSSDPAAPPLPIDPAANPAAAAPGPGGAIPGVAFDQAPGTGGAVQGMEIVVKFKDDDKIKDIIDTFWKDRPSAAAKFDALKSRRPEFANLKLDRVTYSNELVLVHDGSAPAGQRLTAMRAIAVKLKNVADISYAEPNMTAHPGGQ